MSDAPTPPADDAAAQALAERLVGTMLARDAFSRWLGVRLEQVAPRRVTVAMTVRAEMTNGFGVCHGGVTFALADSALAFACNTHGHVTVSIENSMTYPAAVHAGDELVAEAEPEGEAQRLAFYRVLVKRRGGDTVAIFRGTVYRTRKPLE